MDRDVARDRLAARAAVIVLSLVRLGIEMPHRQSDKLGHILAYATLMFWFGQIYSRTARALHRDRPRVHGRRAGDCARLHELPQLRICRHGANATGVVLGWLLAPPRTANVLLLVERST